MVLGQSMGFKSIITCISQQNPIHSSFTALKFLCACPLQASLPPTFEVIKRKYSKFHFNTTNQFLYISFISPTWGLERKGSDKCGRGEREGPKQRKRNELKEVHAAGVGGRGAHSTEGRRQTCSPRSAA